MNTQISFSIEFKAFCFSSKFLKLNFSITHQLFPIYPMPPLFPIYPMPTIGPPMPIPPIGPPMPPIGPPMPPIGPPIPIGPPMPPIGIIPGAGIIA